MSGIKGTLASRELLVAGVPQVPAALEREILAGIQEPSLAAQAAGAEAIELAKLRLRERHYAEKRAQVERPR